MPGYVSREIEPCLREALADLALPRAVQARLAQHWQLVCAWGERLNLTAITDPEVAAWLHYRDALAALAVLPTGPIVDLGSGAGFPGVPLAMVDPERAVTLVEPRRKRASFLRTVVARLALERVTVLEARAAATPDRLYAAALTRATFADWRTLAPALGWLAPGGILIAYRHEPLREAPPAEIHPYRLRGEPRCLQIWRSQPSSSSERRA